MAPGNFEIRVPKGSGQQVTAELNSIPADRRASWRMHRVEEGESLSSVARLFNLPAAKVAEANGLRDEPAPGDRLLIPVAYHETAAPVRAPKASARGSRSSTASRTPAKRTGVATLAQLRIQNHSFSR
jgi:membrane-bound lytic murein transglycosylase D